MMNPDPVDVFRCTAPLTTAEERDAFARLRAGDQTQADRIVRANMRFAIKIARIYAKGPNMDLLDTRISDASAGLLKAVQRFDPDRGVRFISYAVWWIKQSILKAMREERRAYHVSERICNRIQKLERELATSDGQAPQDICADICASPVESAAVLDTWTRHEHRLDAKPTAADREDLHEFIADARVESEDEILDHIDAERIRGIMHATLEPREEHVMAARLGLDSGDPQILMDIGTGLGLTRERARQIFNTATDKVKHRLAANAVLQASRA